MLVSVWYTILAYVVVFYCCWHRWGIDGIGVGASLFIVVNTFAHFHWQVAKAIVGFANIMARERK